MTSISTPRLLLRPFRDTDADAIVRALEDPRISRTTYLIPHPYTLADARKWLELCAARADDPAYEDFAIEIHGELIGSISLEHSDAHRRAQVGYWLATPWWNRGICTEALRAVIEHAFTSKRCDRVYAYHYVGNEASGRVMQKAGMIHEGTLRAHVIKDGIARDCAYYGVLRSEVASPMG